MNLFTHHKQFASLRKTGGTSLGFVPTMGALHSGHISLIEKAYTENDQVLVSIFINPTQFNDTEDLSRYPANLQTDIAQITKIAPEILIYAPEAEDLYGDSIEASAYDFGLLDAVMEGSGRDGHFQGVATVVEKLFRLFMPQRAYFGEKDFQQLQIIKHLVAVQQFPIQIISCPIIRDQDGLALSSRNQLLTKSARNCAKELYAALLEAKKLLASHSLSLTVQKIHAKFEKHPEIKLEYFDIRDALSLEAYNPKQHQNPHAFIAAKLGKIRLIDNLSLEKAIPLLHAN